MKLIETFSDYPMVTTDRHSYVRYKIGRLKHHVWLKNRKRKDSISIDTHDAFMLRNLLPGSTCVFGSAGYYLEELIEDLSVVEMHPIVKKFYPRATIVDRRSQISEATGKKFDNFLVVNNRGDMWLDQQPFIDLIGEYTQAMNIGCRFFYSFRDTQIPSWNRLKQDHYRYFYDFGCLLESAYDLKMIWHDIRFAKKEKKADGSYDMLENPDTTNGNIKFIFEYKKPSGIPINV